MLELLVFFFVWCLGVGWGGGVGLWGGFVVFVVLWFLLMVFYRELLGFFVVLK